ncbi:hypothetical protein Tco_0123614 [Tanacetum coccineum]
MISLSRGSFDVTVGMDWLSKRKFVIVCYDKVVRIPLKGDEIFRVHGERTLGAAKALMNAKVDEPRISDIPVELNITDVFPEDLSMTTMTTIVQEEVVIVCHEKVVRISLEGDEILRVQDLVPGVTPVAKSLYRLAPSEMQEWSEQLQEFQDKVGDALSRKERVKSRQVRGMILAAQSKAFKQENVLVERLHGLEQQIEKIGDESLYFMDRIWVLLVGSVMDEAHASRLRWMIYFVVLADAAESVKDAIGFKYCLACLSGWTKGTYESDFGGYNEGMSPILWAEIRESRLIGPELVLETANKVVLIKEELKAMRDRQKSYVDFMRKLLESEVGDRVLLKVSPWKGVVHFEKKGNANLHVPLNEIKIDKTLRFVEEPVEIMDREINSLKRSRIPLVKVCWNSKCGPEFTWKREDYMKSKYPRLFVDRANKSAS